MDYNISFEWSPLLLIPAILIAGLISYWLYRKDERFSGSTKKILLTIRWIALTILFLLLINPIIKHFKNTVEKPTYVLAIDNSKSVKNAITESDIEDLKNQIQFLKSELIEREINFEIIGLDSKSLNIDDSIAFNLNKTDLSDLLSDIQKRYDNRNLAGILLISDGLFNRGISPLFKNYKNRISTLGLGDTSEVKDVWINELQYNEIAFVDNYFPLNIKIQQNGMEGKRLSLQISDENGILKDQSIVFSEGENLKTIEFKLLAKEKGQKRLLVEILTDDEPERLRANNSRDAYFEVIDGRDKILIVSMGPHPDIKAIKTSLGKNSNYEIETVFASEKPLPDGKFDLVIFHQIPNVRNLGNRYIKKFMDSNTPIWFIMGPSSDYFELNRNFKGVLIRSQVRQMDEVIPLLNPDFDKFKFPENSEEVMFKLPPMNVPFANFSLGEGTEIALYQGLGKINTSKPLLAIQQTQDNKYALLAGDELWAWRMYEFANFENFEFTDAIIQKTVQYLSLKDDKRKFRIRLRDRNNLYEGNPVVFQTEIYNDILEPVYGKEVQIILKDEKGESNNYSYINSANTNFEIKGLGPGIYSYKAKTVIDGKDNEVEGQFSIRKMELESLTFKADFDLLKKIAQRNNGIFISEINENNLDELIGDNRQGIIHSREVNIDIISLFWIFFMILVLISIEWFVRKYSGAY